MSIYFLRHVKTIYNQNNIISGCMEAEILPNQFLTYTSPLPSRFDYVLSSPSKRCYYTLELLPGNRINTIECFNNLLERNVGILEGLQKNDAISQFPYFFHNGKIDINANIPDGESINDVKQRLKSVVSRLNSINIGENVLVCSHNQTLKVLYAMLKNIDLNNEYWQRFNLENGALVNIDDITF